MSKKQKKLLYYNWRFYKELVLALLAIISIVFVIYEYVAEPSDEIITYIVRFDIAVALIFLTDFLIALLRSKNKRFYLKKNWYLLLASIPILDSWAELLRGLRLLELVRLVRAGEHLTYAVKSTKKDHK